MQRCACGYWPDVHDPDGRCPLCACGRLPSEHIDDLCPGKPANEAGNFPKIRRGRYRVPDAGPQFEHRPGWGDVRFPVAERVATRADVVPDPIVRARLTESLDEIPPAAMKCGMPFAAKGATVEPWFYVRHDAQETCFLKIKYGDMFAAAFWDRAPGGNWRTGGVLLRARGEWPRKVGIRAFMQML